MSQVITKDNGNNILTSMLKYQNKYKIKGACYVNSLFYHDNVPNCKIETGIMVYKKNMNVVFVAHCWCSKDDKNIETSFEYINIPDKKYYKSIKELFIEYDDMTDDQKKYIIKNVSMLNVLIVQCTNNYNCTPEGYKKMRDYVLPRISGK